MIKSKPGTREEDRYTEDETARETLGPRGVPGAPDTAKMTAQEQKISPNPATLTATPLRSKFVEVEKSTKPPGTFTELGLVVVGAELF